MPSISVSGNIEKFNGLSYISVVKAERSTDGYEQKEGKKCSQNISLLVILVTDIGYRL